MYELAVTFQGEPVRLYRLAAKPAIIGRDPGADIPVGDASVSRHHAMFFAEGERLFVRDLGSSNGTWLRGERINGPEPLEAGDDVRVGLETTVQVRAGDGERAVDRVYDVEDVGTGWRVPVATGELTFGHEPHAWWWLPDPEVPGATLCIGSDGSAALTRGDARVALRIGDSFEVGGRSFRLLQANRASAPTANAGGAAFGYRLAVGFRSSGEAWAELTADPVGRTYRVNSGNKALLLYLLGRPFADAATPGPDGWVPDEAILTGIWGRSGDANKLYVLLHRLRTDLAGAGLDPACVEKRTGMTRLRIRGGEVTGYT